MIPFIYRQKWIERADLKNNPDVVFLFGDNVERKGLGGQAKAMRGEPNALGVATKWAPHSGDSAFFSDDRIADIEPIFAADIAPAFQAIHEFDKLVVLPTDGLGTGLSELPQRAPQCNAILEEYLRQLVAGESFVRSVV